MAKWTRPAYRRGTRNSPGDLLTDARFYIIDPDRERAAQRRGDKAANPFPSNREHRWCWEFFTDAQGKQKASGALPGVNYIYAYPERQGVYIAYIKQDERHPNGDAVDRFNWHTMDMGDCYEVQFSRSGPETVFIDAPVFLPQPEPAPPEREVHRHEITDEELHNGLQLDWRYSWEVVFPTIRIVLEKDPDNPPRINDKYTLYSTDNDHFYRRELSISDNVASEDWFIELHFPGTPYDLAYSLEFKSGSDGNTYLIHENKPASELNDLDIIRRFFQS